MRYLFVVWVALLAGCPQWDVPPPTTPMLVGGNEGAIIGQEFNVPISLANGSNVVAVSADLTWDEQKVTAVQRADGMPHCQLNPAIGLESPVKKDLLLSFPATQGAKILRFGIIGLTQPNQNVIPDGLLVQCKFRALAAGKSVIRIAPGASNADGDEIEIGSRNVEVSAQ